MSARPANASLDSLEPGGSERDLWPAGALPATATSGGLWILLATLTAFFLLFCAAYLMRMRHGDWLVLPEPAPVWINTLLLGGSSLLFQRATVDWSVRRIRALWLFHAAGLFGLLFLLGQLWVWRLIAASGYFAAGNPATAFFFLLTGLHALHLVVGLVLWLRLSYRVVAGRAVTSIRYCVRYWHFLLLVWLLLLLLFTMT